MKPIAMALGGACLALLFWAFALDDNPARQNRISSDGQPVQPAVLPVEEAVTLAQTSAADGRAVPLLIVSLSAQTVTAIDLTRHGAIADSDLFAVMSQVGEETLQSLYQRATAVDAPAGLTQDYDLAALRSAAGDDERHIGTGTNFPEHAEETRSSTVFVFPKFGKATPPVTKVTYHSNVLLDYEVELCMRLDRDIQSLADFEAARKGFFLCGDFTDRAMLLQMVDPGNFDSGLGFSDAKSGLGFFPSGPFLVVPRNWQKFVAAERIQTLRNGHIRQDAYGREMILGFEELVEKVLNDTQSTRFVYRGNNHRLVPDGMIAKGQVLMSGTPEGVIFMPPTPRQIARGLFRYLGTVGFARGQSPYESVIASTISDEQDVGRYLQIGERITYLSASLGRINMTVAPAADAATQ